MTSIHLRCSTKPKNSRSNSDRRSIWFVVLAGGALVFSLARVAAGAPLSDLVIPAVLFVAVVLLHRS